MTQYKLGFIGAGLMAEAILKGVIKNNLYQPSEIIVSDINKNRLESLKQDLDISVTSDNNQIVLNSELIIIAVKPQVVDRVLEGLSCEKSNKKTYISIAAGINTEYIEGILGSVPVIRVMPNTPVLVGKGMAALCKGNYADDDNLALAEQIFKSVGKTVVVEEKLMDAVTGISGSGPAYVYQFIEAMADGGVQVGLPRDVAYTLAAQTVIGAGLMVLETGLHPGELKDMVTSPGGTTIKALNVLEKAGVRAAVMDAVEAAYLKAKKLGSEK